MCYKDHIWSKILINNLIKKNMVPKLIIEEESNFGIKKKNFYDELILDTKKDISNFDLISDIVKKYNIKHLIVESHNNLNTKNILSQSTPDIILLANTRILKPEIFEIAKIGTFNCHPDKLPGYRGSVVFLRRILENSCLGVTCHWVNKIVDTGSIAYYQDVELNPDDTLGDIVYNIIVTSSNLFEKILTQELIPSIKQDITDTPLFKFPEESLIQECRDFLRFKNKNINNNS